MPISRNGGAFRRPHAGAWIETGIYAKLCGLTSVAPHAGGVDRNDRLLAGRDGGKKSPLTRGVDRNQDIAVTSAMGSRGA